MQCPSLLEAETVDWQQAPCSLASDELHVWSWDTNQFAATNECLSWLDAAEQQWHNQLATTALKQRYAGAHLGMRRVLASYLQVAPQQVAYHISQLGKPSLPGSELHFNLSHTSSQVLLAVSKSNVGIDCEQLREVTTRDSLASKHFTTEELAAYHQSPATEAVRYFFQTWTRKEAIVKLTGLGLTARVEQLNTQAGEQSVNTVAIPPTWNTSHSAVVLMDLTSPSHLAASLAVEQQPAQVRCYRMTDLG
ncbi:4'-phosphopantetheinyl transferase family protein [Aeoliella mucimassa]|uniref:4'-phosphopantetheinyl transferase psf-1 n=1 Tax=Aeoliella mucimassa TaxID=2527972 RepID=A0A518ASR3_9BACT|nr:4'-phosphopantetheinyl transferase superfamily protein [Aeoliella mucimassa]QDU57773.1 4'-phosphopantetheinyl transferase psf-1 [Aeoliella mucimassa]